MGGKGDEVKSKGGGGEDAEERETRMRGENKTCAKWKDCQSKEERTEVGLK